VNAAISSLSRSLDSALRLSGWFSVIVATWSLTPYSSVSKWGSVSKFVRAVS
jgi:hypothetical protein